MKTKDVIIVILVVVVSVLGTYIFIQMNSEEDVTNNSGVNISVDNFDECVAVGGNLMDCYPEKCAYNKRIFTKGLVGSQLETDNYSCGEGNNNEVSSFDECVAAGNPVMESYPEQCSHNGKTFVNEGSVSIMVPPVSPTEDFKLIGGDKDEHGCIGSAGYSWCEFTRWI